MESERYVARLDDEQQRYRVWDLQLGVWAQRPSFESERVARSVADALNGHGPAAPKETRRRASKKRSDGDR
jgi:hypothetical protein